MITGNNSTLQSTYIPNIIYIYTLYNIICLSNSYMNTYMDTIYSIISNVIYAYIKVYMHV